MKRYLLGGTGAGRSLYELAVRQSTRIDGIFDNRLPKGSFIDGHCCLGRIDEARSYISPNACFMTCIGSVNSIMRRKEMIDAISIPTEKYPPYFSALAVIEASMTDIGYGVVIFDNTFVGYLAKLGNYVLINPNSYVGHETTIGSYSILAPGVCIAGNSLIGSSVYIGANSTLRDHISVTDNVIIGSGSNVTKDISEPGVYYGNPARLISEKSI